MASPGDTIHIYNLSHFSVDAAVIGDIVHTFLNTSLFLHLLSVNMNTANITGAADNREANFFNGVAAWRFASPSLFLLGKKRTSPFSLGKKRKGIKPFFFFGDGGGDGGGNGGC